MRTPTQWRGKVALGYEPVADAFERNFVEKEDAGATFAVVRDGEPVVDLWGGLADVQAGRLWSEDTLQLIFSGTKGMVAVCMLMLIERGRLDLNAPVAQYWPEFGRAGKESILVSQVVSHTAALPGFREPVGEEELENDVEMARRLEDETPFWSPGSLFYYHPFTYGWLCGELVRRVDGRSIGRFFAEEIAAPLGLDLWIGLPPAAESRVSTMYIWPHWSEHELPAVTPPGDPMWTGPTLGPNEPAVWNTRGFHAAEIPGANGIGTARSMARLYGCLARGGEIDGIRLLEERTVRLGERVLSSGTDPSTGQPRLYGVGFALQTAAQPYGPVSRAFGHGGAGGSQHGAWPDQKVGFSYAMNEMRNEVPDSRVTALLEALKRSIE